MKKTEPATKRDIPGAAVLLVACVIVGIGDLALCAGRQLHRAGVWVAAKVAGV